MTILYYDCFAGISGDMNLAAMIDLGVEPEYLRAELSKLGLDHEFELVIGADSRHAIHGTRVDVSLKNRQAIPLHGEPAEAHTHDHGHHHGDPAEAHTHAHDHHHGDPAEAHGHEHSHHHGEPAEAHGHAHGHHHGDPAEAHTHAHGHTHAPHRNLADIEAIVLASALGDAVKATSLAIFRKVAEAEARVHGKTPEEVHFHEVGATDSIVDIVGAAICFHRLGVDAVWASPVELGGGFVRCAHGVVPVPAPATVEILKGIPTTRGAVRQETTTPTGAAILAALVDEFPQTPALTTEKTGYGIGHRESAIPNVLRVLLARPQPARGAGSEEDARLLQCNIDDMTAEMLGVAMDLLMEKGAMDVHFTPIVMKKNRPATCVSVLCAAAEEDRFKALLFRHTTTAGVKSFALKKTALAVRFDSLETPLGPVTMKSALLHGKVLRTKPELEDCRALAKRHDMSLAEVYALVDASKRS